MYHDIQIVGLRERAANSRFYLKMMIKSNDTAHPQPARQPGMRRMGRAPVMRYAALVPNAGSRCAAASDEMRSTPSSAGTLRPLPKAHSPVLRST